VEIQRNINAGIQKLGNFQLSNGGLSYWQGNNYVDDWATSYAGHFLIEADKKGYVLPIGFKNKWISFQQSEAKKWRFNAQYRNDFAQAYRLYTLALAGSADMGSMNRLRETTGISNESKLRLAAAYALAGQKKAALSLIGTTTTQEDKRYADYYYGSEERNRAMVLETYILVDNKTKAYEMANKLAKDLSSNRYMSTQTTAFGLYAMPKFALKNGGKGVNMTYSIAGKSETVSSKKSFVDRNLAAKQGSNSVTIQNKNSGTLYVRVLNSGILPVGQEKEIQKNFSTSVVYKDRKGSVLNLSSVKQGTEIVAQVTIRNQSDETLENVALSQIVPSGFEIMNSRYTDFGSYAENKADYIDIRDDRTQFYFGIRAGETKTFTMLLIQLRQLSIAGFNVLTGTT
jgi:uncharacterized protein YfaS (alpha-2-macroglobulin family)